MMHENSLKPQRVVLAAVDLGEYDINVSLDELEELADTAGAEVIGRICQNRAAPDKATYMGTGRLAELAEHIKAMEADMVIFESELSPSQQRNIEGILDSPVIDRTTLILDIFAQRAVSGEGKLQVELAQQRYLLPRLVGMGTVLSRLGGGIGTRGPGETKLETDRRHIKRRILALEEQLRELESRRSQTRRRRKKEGYITVAIVGYTNVGKSTLLNALTDADVMAENKLFATLDPTTRALALPDGRNVLLTDTVGLIRRLPHHLIEAFKSTLEEAAQADLILNVCDVSSDEAREQIDVTEQLLEELGVRDTHIITVYNKCDRLPGEPNSFGKDAVSVSAKTGFGFDALLAAIGSALSPTQRRLMLLIPYTKGGLVNELLENGKIYSQEYTESGILLDALVECKSLHKLENMILPSCS